MIHPDALGVRRTEASKFVRRTSSGALTTCRVLRWEAGRKWAQDITDLPRAQPRPPVWCPFCGKKGQYAHTDKYRYFRHADGEQDCVEGDLESIRHQRAKASLVSGLLGAREKSLPVQWPLRCWKCDRTQTRTLLASGAWSSESEEAFYRCKDGKRLKLDAAASDDGTVVGAFEVWWSHRVDPEKLDALEREELPMLEIKAEALIDDEGNETWDGTGPLPVSAHPSPPTPSRPPPPVAPLERAPPTVSHDGGALYALNAHGWPLGLQFTPRTAA